jgi:hypothetical protein
MDVICFKLVSVAMFEGSGLLTGTSVGRKVRDSFSSKVEKLQLLLLQQTSSVGVIRSDF